MIIFFIILIIITAIIFHEFGHYLVARHYGVIAEEFNIGMGPKVCGFEKGGTKWNIRLLQIGGSCVFGKNDNELNHLTTPHRIAVLAAGPFVNFLLGILSLLIAAVIRGGDMIAYIGRALNQVSTFLPTLASAFIEAMSPEYPTLASTGSEYIAATAGMSINEFAVYVFTISYLMNMMLFLFNILPIPGLDGGQIFLAIPELLGKPLKEKTINRLNYAFLVIIMGWSVLYLVKDLMITVINAVL